MRSTLKEIHVVGDKFYLGDDPPIEVRLFANASGQAVVRPVEIDTTVDQQPRRTSSMRVAMARIDQPV